MYLFRFSLLTLSITIGIASFVKAAPNSISHETEKQITARQHQQQNAVDQEIKSQQVRSPNVRLETEKTKTLRFPQHEAKCFPISQLVLTDFNTNQQNRKLIQPSQFHWALSAVYSERDFTFPACIGSEGINVLLRRIQNRLIEAGFVTTRVVVEPQDLRSGMLVLTVIPGKVGHIQLQDRSSIPFVI